MSILKLEVYEIFKNYFTEKEAAKIIEYFEAKSNEKIRPKKDTFITRDDKEELILKIESSKTDIIKWMFILGLSQVAAVAGILFALLNIYLKK